MDSSPEIVHKRFFISQFVPEPNQVFGVEPGVSLVYPIISEDDVTPFRDIIFAFYGSSVLVWAKINLPSAFSRANEVFIVMHKELGLAALSAAATAA